MALRLGDPDARMIFSSLPGFMGVPCSVLSGPFIAPGSFPAIALVLR